MIAYDEAIKTAEAELYTRERLGQLNLRDSQSRAAEGRQRMWESLGYTDAAEAAGRHADDLADRGKPKDKSQENLWKSLGFDVAARLARTYRR